ncbi:unnamed protein product [Tetraodon nigroviridis]|nr:unnamed protein product [Tetraodon nigroviridis]
MESSEERQLNAGDHGQYFNLGLRSILHDHTYARLNPVYDDVPGVPEQQSSHTKQVKKTKRTKKSPNAFMVFMKEKRRTVKPAIKRRGIRAVNAHLRSVWQSLTTEEQEKYCKEAEDQQLLDCSTNETDDKMLQKGKKRRLPENKDEGTSSHSMAEESPPSKLMRLTPKYRKQTSKKDATEIHWDMKLRPGKRPNYQE